MSDFLPPHIVAAVDQRLAQTGDVLDDLIDAYRVDRDRVGETDAIADMATMLYAQCEPPSKGSLGAVIDLLAVAVKRLADRQGE